MVFPPFKGNRPIDHILYLGSDPLLLMQRVGRLILSFQLQSPVDRIQLETLLATVSWEVFKEGRWQSLASPTFASLATVQIDTFTLTFEAFAGADLTALSGPGLNAPLSSRWIRGQLVRPLTQLLYTDFSQITAISDVVQVRPALAAQHPQGAMVVKVDVSTTPVTMLSSPANQGARTIQIMSGRGLAQGDILLIDDGVQPEFVTLGAIPTASGAVTTPIAPSLRFNHAINLPLRRITIPLKPITTTLTQQASAGGTTLSLSGSAGLGINAMVSIRENPQDSVAERLHVDTVTTRVEQLTPPFQGIPPDQVHVNTTPADFTRDFHPLGENPRAGDTFYVASTEALSKVEATLRQEVRSKVELAVEINTTDASLRWEFFGGEQNRLTWIPLGEVRDRTGSLTRDGDIGFSLPSEPFTVSIRLAQEHTVRVLFFRISIASGTYYKVPCLRALRVTVRTPTPPERQVAPLIAFISETPLEVVDPQGTTVDITDIPGLTLLDVREPFYPFGLSPTVENTFYFGLPADVRPDELQVLLIPQTSRLIWEFLSLDGWKRLGESSTREQIIGLTDYEFRDETLAFTREAIVSFRRPHDLARGEVNGQANYWLRARLVSGYYGRPLEFIPVNAADPSKGFKPRPGTGALNAPVVSSIRLNYSAQNPSPLVVTHNQFVLEDRTDANKTANTSFKPFEPVEEKEPTFYLSFDQPLPNNAINLYFVVPPRQFVEKLKTDVADPNGGDRRLLWEYWNGREWARLVVADETKDFTESGSVQFLGPTDLAALAKFDPPSRYWLRVRLLERTEDYAHLLSGVFLNAVRVVQATTLRGELLGSSSGRKNQVFRLSRRPVFAGQRIEVREPERPSAEEEADITAEEGKEAIQTIDGPDGARQIWVRWHEVKSLNRSGSRSRHYTIDRITGEVRFGDGVRGLIPPEGRDTIVCKSYRAGGGAAGNQAAGALSQLKTSIPYIASVTNPIAADGGSDAETLQAVQERGPQTLKHRSRAVAAEDFEWLARQAAGTRVARARCLPNRNRDLDFEPGWVTLIIVPSGTEKKLLPSAELIREVEDDLATRSLATLTTLIPAHINVIGPGYVPVEVAVEVMPIELTQADAVRRAVLDALERFFHPLTGGPAGEGWEFGRDVYLSELFAAFENLPGVEHVHSLSFKPTVATVPLQFTSATDRAYPVGEAVTVAIDGNSLGARLVEPLPVGASDAMVTMFREGERVTLTPREGGTAQAVEITVRGISGNMLTVDSFRAQVPFVAGSEVASVDGASATFLIAAIPQGTRVSVLTVQGFAPGQSVRLAGGGALALKFLGDVPNQRLDLGQRLRVPEFYLVYSGAHTVDISPI